MSARTSLGLLLLSALVAPACAQITGLSDLRIHDEPDSSTTSDAGPDSSSSGTGGAGTGGVGTGGAPSSTGGAGGTVSSGGAGGRATDGSPGPDAGDGGLSDGAVPADASDSGGAGGCQGKPGPVMVQADGFCIDSTEVTASQYEAFTRAATAATISQQGTECAWNTSIVPTDMWPPPGDALNEPVRYVDWCDAQAYCKWAGKRLCGKIGGGTVPYDQYASNDVSQWMHACTSNGSNWFPYGSTYNATACNGEDLHPFNEVLTDVGTMPLCHGFGAYADVFDMAGNVLEWEDSCETNPAPPADAGTGPGTDLCRIRGGSILSGESGMYCDVDVNDQRNASFPLVGFRCCAD